MLLNSMFNIYVYFQEIHVDQVNIVFGHQAEHTFIFGKIFLNETLAAVFKSMNLLLIL